MNDYIEHTVNLQPLAIKLDDALSRGDLEAAQKIAVAMLMHLIYLRVWINEQESENERD
jgi:hypothetical protein